MHTAPHAETCLCAHNYRFLHKGCRCFYFNPVLQCLKFNTEVTPARFSFFTSSWVTPFLQKLKGQGRLFDIDKQLLS